MDLALVQELQRETVPRTEAPATVLLPSTDIPTILPRRRGVSEERVLCRIKTAWALRSAVLEHNGLVAINNVTMYGYDARCDHAPKIVVDAAELLCR